MPEAYKWYLIAAKRNYLKAQEMVSMGNRVGVGVVRNDADAYMWLLIAQYNGAKNTTSEMIRIEEDLTLETRERTQKRAKICVESNYTKCD